MPPPDPAMEQRRLRLCQRFRQQQRFAAESSPLTACLCGVVAQWLEQPWGEEDVAMWLVQVSASCSSVAVPMLLMAAVHRAILADDPPARGLAEYFPSVGGPRPVDAWAIKPLLHQVLLACQQQISTMFAASTVQTNESCRGLCWLLPLLYTGWQAVHLVDLGCSAGLNLVADLRQYQLLESGADEAAICVGQGAGAPFIVASSDDFVAPQHRTVPQVLSRLGCDRQPLQLKTEADEFRLASFVWGDQVQRLRMLRQGIEALHSVEQSVAPVQLVAANLPDDLEALLDAHLTRKDRAAVVLYNTYLTSYLSCKGSELAMRVANWAKRQEVPVLWLQWEPLRHGPPPPAIGWLGWTADLWTQGVWRRYHLAWVHPHGTSVAWLPGLADWSQLRPSHLHSCAVSGKKYNNLK